MADTRRAHRRRRPDRPDGRDRTRPPRSRLRIVDPIIDPRNTPKPLAYNPVRSRSSKAWACCAESWTPRSRCTARSSMSTARRSPRSTSRRRRHPFGFIAIPQYATERILREELAMHGVQIERGMRLAGFEQDDDGVTATLDGDGSRAAVRARYLIGADGAHSTRAQGAGPDIRGCGIRGAVHARRRRGRLVGAAGLRSPVDAPVRRHDRRPAGVHSASPGARSRYRMSMLVPDELSGGPATAVVAHGFEGERKPELHPSRRCWIGCHPNPPRREICGGPRCFGSVTALSTPMAAAGCSSREMRRTSIPPPARRV